MRPTATISHRKSAPHSCSEMLRLVIVLHIVSFLNAMYSTHGTIVNMCPAEGRFGQGSGTLHFIGFGNSYANETASPFVAYVIERNGADM